MRRRLISLICMVSLLGFLLPVRPLSADTPVNLIADGGFESASAENEEMTEVYAPDQWTLYTAGNSTR